MKRRVVSIITALAMCLSLCPTWALAAGQEPDSSLCPHHPAHTEACGYAPPSGRDCAHQHDESCFITQTLCVHQHTEDCYAQSDSGLAEPSVCTHVCSEESGCVTLTLDCPHVHSEACGYIPGDAGAPCTFVCRICPVEALIAELPASVTPENRSQTEDQLQAILALYAALSAEEQEQLDLSRCFDLQSQLDAANTPMLSIGTTTTTFEKDEKRTTPYDVKSGVTVLNINGHSIIVSKPAESAVSVPNGGDLTLKGGQVISENGAGVRVESGGILRVEDSGMTVSGKTYGLYIASGAEAELSGGTFTGTTAAIWTEDGDFSALLKAGYTYFDADGKPIPLENVAAAETVVIGIGKDQPVLTWSTTAPVTINYDGSPVEKTDLPNVLIDIKGTEDLRQYLQYSYKKNGDAAFTEGLPTNAGTYEIVVSLPEMDYYYAASSAPLTLTIEKINPIVDAPAALSLVYNEMAQNLVTAGVSHSGTVIQFAQNTAGPYSTSIPTGINAGTYSVWYKVEETENYLGVPATPIQNVKIQRKQITPAIELSETSFVYDGSKKQPQITVKDGATVIDSSQYTVTWNTDWTTAGTHKVTITGNSGGNYEFSESATAEIVEETQTGMSIIGVPSRVCYGDTVTTLNTTGGSGNGTVAWSIETSGAKSSFDGGTEKLTVRDVGAITVKAVRTVDNYKDAEAFYTITIEPKPVTAVVTVANKTYDGTNTASVTAEVSASDLVDNDSVTISGLTGTFDDVNAGANKTVTLNSSNVSVSGDSGKYSITYPASAAAAITPKLVTPAVTLSGNDLKTDSSGVYYYEFDGNEKTPAVTLVDGSEEIPTSNYTVRYSDNKNFGTATVTVMAKTDGNYTFSSDISQTFEIRKVRAELTQSPQAKNLTYTGQLQELVTVGTANGGTVVYCETKTGNYAEKIPEETDAGTYIVYYMVRGDDNHEDTGVSAVSVTINPKEITPAIKLTPTSYKYDGTAREPAVTVEDGGKTIDPKEYLTSYQNNINAGTATVTISDANGGNYIVNGTASFTIEKAEPAVVAPAGKGPLQYNGSPQELITRGSSTDGTMVYALDGANYSAAVPTGTAVGPYTVYYKVLGDANHKDSAAMTISVSIDPNTVNNPTITLSSDTFRYNGSQQKPTITVRDDNGFLIPENEYEVTYTGTGGNDSMVSVDNYTITVTTKTNSNYKIQSNNTRTFRIVEADQEVISITERRDRVYYGDTIQLGTTGGTGSGTVAWSVTDASGNSTAIASITSGGLLTVRGVGGPVVVTATRSAGGNYSEISTTWEFRVEKKPVTAVLTGVDRPYADNDRRATVKAEVSAGDLVASDSITIPDMTGTFDDENVGTNKKITITSPAPTVSGTNADKYVITYPTTATASITPVDAAVVTDPAPASGLTYDAGKALALVTAGAAEGGTMVYSLDGAPYSPAIPTARNAGAYTVYFKVQGNSNHNDSPAKSVSVTIDPKTVTPQVELTPSSAQYDGNVKRPAVTVRDDEGRVIQESEYKVTYDPNTDWKLPGPYTVKVADIPGGNYAITEAVATFTITISESNPLEIVNKPGLVRYGDAPFTLSAVGGSGTGTISWRSSDEDIASIESNGLVTIKSIGTVTITATRAANGNYEASTATYQFTVQPKPITAIVTAEDKVYDGKPDATVHIDWKAGDLVGNDSIVIGSLSGTFATADVGTNKEVGISASITNDNTSQKYTITIPPTTTASISMGAARLDIQPAAESGLVYNKNQQALVSNGTTVNSIGVIEYSLDQNGPYSTAIPKAAAAGEHTVWYRVQGTSNYAGIDPESVTVTIAKATPTIDSSQYPTASSITSGQTLNESNLTGGTANIGTEAVPGSFAWGDKTIKPVDGDSYDVIFTPNDTTNYNTVTIQVPVTVTTVTNSPATEDDPDPEPDSSTDSTNSSTASNSAPAAQEPGALMQTSVQNSTARTVVSAAAGSELVRAAAASQSKNVVIKPEITGNVTKTEVTIPASTVGQIQSETDADLTVSTPVADVTIPNAALNTLSSAGGAVSVVTEQAEQTVTLTLTAGGATVEDIPGGLTLTVPVEDAGPGTVAVLVRDDGTRETIRKSVAEDGALNIPLSGSATVEIVDNSKDFADVQATDWEADAVAFASAHELFSGTSETTFSPDLPMSRAMLATVLYNLEGRPEQSLTDEFDDVGSDAWYAESVSWATANDIANGYADGQFGPEEDVTREQFAVMLWRYAGSPAADIQALGFTDADEISSYAMEALCWAAANGILNGYEDGRLDPGGTTTRAQAAQILKNFMENT